MEKILQWVKGIVLIFFVLSTITYLIPKEEYKKYVLFFVNLIVTIAIISPCLSFFGKEDGWSNMLKLEEFKLQMTELKEDENDAVWYQSRTYEELLEKEANTYIKNDLKKYGTINEVEVELNAEGGISSIKVAFSLLSSDSSEEIMKDYLASAYQVDETKIEVSREEG